ncbi:hypothetical protein D9615_002135 [Tricholomella constricta]|uniref:Uncharacterized protein n=1 Tax=Tricholomella constricta TaxID=117010 RepID=A0A8H5MA03_9AGAR|nr:hypothetical protein D9615_002135 [Tricholomella constricta]
MEAIGSATLTTTAEVFLTLRVYAVLERRKPILFVAGAIILCQWGLVFYLASQASKGTAQVAVLLSRNLIPDLPAVPDTDPYHSKENGFSSLKIMDAEKLSVCILISTLHEITFGEAILSLALAFDGLAFIGIVYGIAVKCRATTSDVKLPLMRVIKRDGIIYFLVLFSSNLVWLILLLHARPALKFIHNQPAMVYVFHHPVLNFCWRLPQDIIYNDKPNYFEPQTRKPENSIRHMEHQDL